MRDLPPELRDMGAAPPVPAQDSGPGVAPGYLESIEASAMRKIIADEKGNLSRVAAVLGISRPTLYRKMRQYGLDRK